ncbi:hypothetical protein FRACA_2800007 [Frankia canadensis]|uniref:Uncharacterized protein n=1 Tax=Frankia canadensis TaxID=1836972 RepID=A0A2I2KT53_9ACTN|nr:hypothetical protein FRACA_2800007 [Frankia canadensis]SOU56116.1 hypothetical protein FRACA_2800007 [Frankia canadensis]
MGFLGRGTGIGYRLRLAPAPLRDGEFLLQSEIRPKEGSYLFDGIPRSDSGLPAYWDRFLKIPLPSHVGGDRAATPGMPCDRRTATCR